MAAPDTRFIWDDQSVINPNTAVGNDGVDRPVLMTVFSSDKGPEKFQKELSGEDFFALYGDNPNYFKHGQALVQAAAIANAGGLQYAKRVVAPDSKLANLALIATVRADKIQKTNAKGKPLYYKTEVDQTYWAVKEEADIPDAYKTKRITTDINTDAWEDYTPEMIEVFDTDSWDEIPQPTVKAVDALSWEEISQPMVEVVDTASWQEVPQPKVKVLDTDSWEKTGDNVTPPSDASTYTEYADSAVSTYAVGAKVKVTKGAVITYYKAKVAHKPLMKEVPDDNVPEYSVANVPTYTVNTIVKSGTKFYKAKVAHKPLMKEVPDTTIPAYSDADVPTYGVGKVVKSGTKFYKAKVAHKPLMIDVPDEHVPEYSVANISTYTVGTIVKFETKFYKAKVANKALKKQVQESIDNYNEAAVDTYIVGSKVKEAGHYYKAKVEKTSLYKIVWDINVPAYAPGTAYDAGKFVVYGGKYYAAAQAITGTEVGVDTTPGVTVQVETTDSKTNDVSNTPIKVDAAMIKYSLKAVPLTEQVNNTDDIDKVFNSVVATVEETKDTLVVPETGEKNYVLFTLTDTGRGISNKKIRIYADTSARRPVRYIKYVMKVLEGNKELETHYFTFDNLIVESSDGSAANAKNKAVDQVINQNSRNIRCKYYESEWNKFVDDVSEKSKLTKNEVAHMDILFAFDRYGKVSNAVGIDPAGDNLSVENGILLQNGDNGAFGDYPIALPEILNSVGDSTGMSLYDNQVLRVFNGSFADDIYDLDNTRIDAIFDANYKRDIKDAIHELVTFREDCFFFRDFGLGLTTLNEIEAVNDTYKKNKFVANYINSYDVIEPYYRKQVNVTIMYNLVTRFVGHYLNGVNRPFCGQAYGVTFENDIIPGTINFSPKRTPQTDENAQTYNQKEWFDNERLNYVAYYSGIPTLDTEYTSQTEYTQLSWINNVLLVQKIIHEIRKQCPKNRYTFLDGQDLLRYKADVEAVLNRYKSQFKEIGVEYAEDEQYELNKIFYAVIKVKFRDFIQSEIFKITMIN